jgi:site-specific recombinase XerD
MLNDFPDPVSVKNIRRSSAHWLRHGFVTQLFKTTSDIATVSKMARHMDLKTTSQYSHAEAEKQQKILDQFADGFR